MDLMTQWMHQANPLGERGSEPPPRKRWFQASLIEFVRPDGYWPYPYSIEQAFEILRWMVATGASKVEYTSQHRWGTVGVADLLTPGSGIGHTNIAPITSLDDLQSRFHLALLARPQSEGQALWRRDQGISPTSTISVRSPVYKPLAGAPHLGWRSESEIRKDLVRMFSGEAGTEMRVSLNSVHPACNVLHGVRVEIYPKIGFVVSLRYGDKHPKDWGSSWDETIACTREGESFLQTVARARDVFDCLVHGYANGCDIGDMKRYYRQEFVTDQVDAIHGRTPAPAETAAPGPRP